MPNSPPEQAMTKLRKTALLFSGAVAVLANLLCVNPGNGSGAGNPMITGRLFEPDGKIPADGAIVKVWEKKSIANIATGNSIKTDRAAYITATDNDGIFSIESIDTGFYSIEGSDQYQNVVMIDSLHIATFDTTLDLPEDTLKAPGAIDGYIFLSSGGNSQQVFILAYGTDRFVQVDTNGKFLFQQLAEGVYTLKILSLSSQYGSIDTGNISVKSDNTTDIGSIDLPLKTIPKVEGLLINYDSRLQRVALLWKKTPASNTKGYNLYRKETNLPSFDSPLNGSFLLHDTLYTDSTVVQDSAYDYMVAAVDLNDNEGPPSDDVQCTISVALYLYDSLRLFSDKQDYIYNLMMDKQGNYIIHRCVYGISGKHISKIETYSKKGNLLNSFQLPSSQSDGYPYSPNNFFAVESTNTIYFKNDVGSIYRINENGNIQKVFINEGIVSSFDFYGKFLYYIEKIGSNGYVKKYSFLTDSITILYDCGWTIPHAIRCDPKGEINLFYTNKYNTSSKTPVLRFTTRDTLGFVSSKDVCISGEIDHIQMKDSLYFGFKGNDIDGSSTMFLLFTKQGEIVLKNSFPYLTDAIITSYDEIIASDTKGRLLKFRFRR